MSPRWCVDVGEGMVVQFDRKPTPAMIEAARVQMAELRKAIPELTPEQVHRQDAALERNRERLRRLGIPRGGESFGIDRQGES